MQSSQSECNAMVRALVECVRYLVNKSIQDDEFELVEHILSKVSELTQ